ncbi:hypothetical protein DXG01_004723 [Tephrocybe rancida]|nr:hypothetical protein DXG01_004723 [Tephrocybe rancida]
MRWTAEQLAISWMCPEKFPVSQEEVGKEDDQEFEEEIQVQLTPKGKKGKGKTSKVNGPFKSGPVPDQAKERAFTIHAEFKKQIQDLAAEIGKAPQLLFSLMGEGPLPSCRAPNQWSAFEAWYGVNGEKKKSEDMSSQDWTKLKWKDPDAVAELFTPIVAWHKEKHGAYVDEMKAEGTFNKVVGKVQHEFMHLGNMAYKYNGVHCFGFIVNLQPNHTGRTVPPALGCQSLMNAEYVLDHKVPRFGGDLQPPRYGPPAPYQVPYLPEGWTSTPSPLSEIYSLPSPFDPELHGLWPYQFDARVFEPFCFADKFQALLKENKESIKHLKQSIKADEDWIDKEIAADMESRRLEREGAFKLKRDEELQLLENEEPADLGSGEGVTIRLSTVNASGAVTFKVEEEEVTIVWP